MIFASILMIALSLVFTGLGWFAVAVPMLVIAAMGLTVAQIR